jgi:hypothetical protein
MLCGKGRVRTQDLGYQAERYDHCATRPVDDLEDPQTPYTLSSPAAESWRNAGQATMPCRCNEPAEYHLSTHLRPSPLGGPIPA